MRIAISEKFSLYAIGTIPENTCGRVFFCLLCILIWWLFCSLQAPHNSGTHELDDGLRKRLYSAAAAVTPSTPSFHHAFSLNFYVFCVHPTLSVLSHPSFFLFLLPLSSSSLSSSPPFSPHSLSLTPQVLFGIWMLLIGPGLLLWMLHAIPGLGGFAVDVWVSILMNVCVCVGGPPLLLHVRSVGIPGTLKERQPSFMRKALGPAVFWK